MPATLVTAIADKLDALNAAIAADRALGAQFQVGHSFVTPPVGETRSAEGWRHWYAEAVETEIAPLLAEYWFDDPAKAEQQAAMLRLDG